MVQTAAKGVLPENRNRHRANGAKARNEDVTTSGTEPKGRPVVVLGRRIPLKPEHGLFGRHKPYGTKSARNILRIRIFCATFGTSDPL